MHNNENIIYVNSSYVDQKLTIDTKLNFLTWESMELTPSGHLKDCIWFYYIRMWHRGSEEKIDGSKK